MADYMFTVGGTFCVGVLASFIGSQVGSGGTIVVPFLIFMGLPPHVAIGTHKLATFCGGISSLKKYLTSGHVQWKYVAPFTIIGIISSITGANILLQLDEALLKKLVGFAILLPLPFLCLSKIGLQKKNLPPYMLPVGLVAYALLSVWGGIFSPGAVTLFIYLQIMLFGFTYIEAVTTRRIPSMVNRIALLSIFIHAGIVNLLYGIPLAFGYILGAYIGASTAIAKGNTWIRGLLIMVVAVSAIKLLLL